MATKKKAAAVTPARRGDPLSIRIDPKVRYGLELLARDQRRSVTGVVEWSILQAFRNETVTIGNKGTFSFEDLLNQVWEVNELERLVRLAFDAPQLMTYEEERMMRVLASTDTCWRSGSSRSKFSDFDFSWILPSWEPLKPVLIEASERPTVTGLTDSDLQRAGLDIAF